MTCERCEGLMVLDRFYDFRDDQHQFEFTAWHCLNCGEVLDPILLRNRRDSVASNCGQDTELPVCSLDELVAEDKLIEASLEHSEGRGSVIHPGHQGGRSHAANHRD